MATSRLGGLGVTGAAAAENCGTGCTFGASFTGGGGIWGGSFFGAPNLASTFGGVIGGSGGFTIGCRSGLRNSASTRGGGAARGSVGTQVIFSYGRTFSTMGGAGMAATQKTTGRKIACSSALMMKR